MHKVVSLKLKPIIEEALSIQIEQHGENSIETAVTINNLGVLSAHLPKAESYLRRTLEVRLHIFHSILYTYCNDCGYFVDVVHNANMNLPYQ
mmetsp:Transcript_6158/g.9201  ORF Transcript_6158/g.9201 Transcript_6158/m.9201 type:complete len:92 (-) Transcript_6158:538-813(-)